MIRKFACITGLLAMTSAAGAADFTFKVPVSIHNMPAEIQSFAVNVQVIAGSWDMVHSAYPHRVGYGNGTTIPLVNGAYEGVVTTVINNYDPHRRPEEAVYYQVNLWMPTAQNKYLGSCSDAAYNQNADYPYDLSKPCVIYYIGKIYESQAPGSASGGSQQGPAPGPVPKPPVRHLPPLHQPKPPRS